MNPESDTSVTGQYPSNDADEPTVWNATFNGLLTTYDYIVHDCKLAERQKHLVRTEF